MTTVGQDQWLINAPNEDQNADPTVAFNPATDTIVPGDVVSYVTHVRLNVAGKNLRATFAALPTGAGTGWDDLEYSVNYECEGDVANSAVTEADNGKVCTLVTSLLGAFTPFYSSYAGTKAAVEHYTRAASKDFGERGISVNAVGPGPMDTPFFYGQESKEAVAYHSSAAALSKYTRTGLTHIEDIAPIVKFLVTDGWWITGQTIFANGGYTTR